MYPIPQLARLNWTEDGQPVSRDFGDIYPSRLEGPQVSRRLFLQANQLETRWQALEPEAAFCIAETGFATGLNFLCAWQLWDRTAPADARLHYVSTEAFPLAAEDLQRTLALWPDLAPWSGPLLAQYSSPAAGWQRYVLADGRVTLTLLIGDPVELLGQLQASVDAWFLADIAPEAAPQLWQPALYMQLARLARTGSTLSTPAAIDTVRDGLSEAGFSTQQLATGATGSPLLTAQLPAPAPGNWLPPWYATPTVHGGSRRAMIIGAGLAGCSTAFALAQRGWQVTLIERHPGEAQEASGNPQGILYCKLSPHQTPLSRFVQTSYAFSLRLLHRLMAQDGSNWSACGVIQLSGDDKEAGRLGAIAAQGYPPNFLQGVTAEQASAIAGVQVAAGGLYFPEGGWVSPPAFCRALLQHPGISLITCRETTALSYRDGLWCADDGQGQPIEQTPVAIICGAGDSRRFAQTGHLPLKTIRGQITQLPATSGSNALRSVLCGEGYVSPARGGEHFLGASFRFDRSDTLPSEEENSGNLALLASLSAELDDALRADTDLDPKTLEARVALRCTTPDYLPLIGPVVDPPAFREVYAVLAKDASKQPAMPAPWQPGLFLNVAHGSRGLISAPLSGELLAAMLENEPMPLPRDLLQAVHPTRFLLRQLIRGL